MNRDVQPAPTLVHNHVADNDEINGATNDATNKEEIVEIEQPPEPTMLEKILNEIDGEPRYCPGI